MNNREEVEIKLLNDYLDAALRADGPGEAARQLSLYEKQLSLCKSLDILASVSWGEAIIYYVKALHKLNTEGLFEGALRNTARQSSGFDGIAPALLAQRSEKGRAGEAIALLDKAISIHDGDVDFWMLRASLHHGLKNKQAALDDVNHVLSEFGDNQDVYLEARKLKDQIDAIESDSGCFIATAVYETPDCIELDILRSFRDEILLRNSFGRLAVTVYYSISPNIAPLIAKSEKAKKVLRVWLLDPIVVSLRKRDADAKSIITQRSK